MSYIIKNIEDYSSLKEVGSNPYYFVDANVWYDFFALVISKKKPLRHQAWKLKYIDFIEMVIEIHLTNNKEVQYQPKIVINSNLLGEIIYAYINHCAKERYYMNKLKLRSADQIMASHKDYRTDIGTDYPTQMRRITGRLMRGLYADHYIELLTEDPKEFGEKMMGKLLSAFAELNHCDFNDFYYYHLCKGRKIPIVTMDKDFAFKGIEIITNHPDLISLVGKT